MAALEAVGGDVLVRPERREDFAAIDAVIVDAFGPEHGPGVTALVERIRGSINYLPELALVAEAGSDLIAHVMLSWVGIQSAARDRILILTPMSVRSDRQREGVGSQLIRAVLALADDAGEPAVVVEGVPGYYPRFGFERASALGFQPPHDQIPDAAFMVKRLTRYDPTVAGRVVYPDAFTPLIEH